MKDDKEIDNDDYWDDPNCEMRKHLARVIAYLWPAAEKDYEYDRRPNHIFLSLKMLRGWLELEQ